MPYFALEILIAREGCSFIATASNRDRDFDPHSPTLSA